MSLTQRHPAPLRKPAPWLGLLLAGASLAHAAPQTIPPTQATALDGHAVTLPGQLPGRATILILGFSRKSADYTTPWEKPVRGSLAHAPEIGFYDMAVLASVPGFARGFALHSLRKAVPDILKPNFVPLFDHEPEWKQIAGFDKSHEDAAYVLLIDRSGTVRWSTHEPFSPAGLQTLSDAARALAARP